MCKICDTVKPYALGIDTDKEYSCLFEQLHPKGHNNYNVMVRWWKEGFKERVLFDLVSECNDILSPSEIDANLKYIREFCIGENELFTLEEFEQIVIPYCEKMKLEHRSENKFPKGTLVRVAGVEGTAIVEYTYAERYGGRDFKSYCLTFYNTQGDRVATQAWIKEGMMSKIEDNETQEENKEI